jgi:hypothetical protein
MAVQQSFIWRDRSRPLQRENVMRLSTQIAARLRRAAMTVVAGAVAAVATVHADATHNIVLVPPAELPALARQTGEALLLHRTIDGITVLYIEQNQGTSLATFDVTDPAHIKGEGSVRLEASGPFDFVSPLGNQAELIQFRDGHEGAVLDLRRVKNPRLATAQRPTLQGQISGAGSNGYPISGRAQNAPSVRDHLVVDSVNSYELNRVFDVNEVRAEMTNGDTGTTFVLTEKGLYVIRRPAVESIHRMMLISPN